MKLSITTILLLYIVSANAQTVLTPGTNAFEEKWIKDTGYQMTWYILKDTSKVEIGTVKTNVFVNAKNIIAVSQATIKGMQTPWIDSSIANRATLQPVYHSSYNVQRNMILHFGKIVTGIYDDKTSNQITTISDTTITDYFDSNIYPVLIGWLPLTEAYTRNISIYDYNPSIAGSVMKASVNKVENGTYESAKSGTRNVWIVTVADQIGGSENISTYYFDKADRRLWKQEINSNGRKMIMQLNE